MWRLVEDKEDSLVNDEFASTIASISNGTYIKKDEDPRLRAKQAAFKPMFWDDPKNNPPIGNTHMSYEFDAQFSEMNKHWKKSGKRFSDEPRIAKDSFFDRPGGPMKPEEIPYLISKPERVFGRKRDVNALMVAKIKNQKHRVTGFVHPPSISGDELTEHLGPGTYTFPDAWTESFKPILGITKGSPSFVSKTIRWLDAAAPHSRGNDIISYSLSKSNLDYQIQSNSMRPSTSDRTIGSSITPGTGHNTPAPLLRCSKPCPPKNYEDIRHTHKPIQSSSSSIGYNIRYADSSLYEESSYATPSNNSSYNNWATTQQHHSNSNHDGNSSPLSQSQPQPCLPTAITNGIRPGSSNQRVQRLPASYVLPSSCRGNIPVKKLQAFEYRPPMSLANASIDSFSFN